MIIHLREIAYTNDFQTFFEALSKAKQLLEKRFPEVSVTLMYNLAGERGFATIQTQYPSLADYEKLAKRWQRWWEATVAKLPSGPGRLRDEEGETQDEREGVIRGLEWLKKGK